MRPLSCAEALALADARLDGAIPAPDEGALRSHLEACGACPAAAAEGRRVHESLLALGVPDPGPAFADRVVARLDRGPRGEDGPAAPASAAARVLRAVVAVAGTASVAAAALVLLPLEEAAAEVAARVPVPAPPVLPEEAAGLLAGLGTAVPAWVAAAAAGAALLGALVPALRRRRPEDPR